MKILNNLPRRNKRFYYPAGLISLILLPILSIWYLNNKYKAIENQRMTENVVWWEKGWFECFLIPYKVHPERKFVDINLTTNENANNINLDLAQKKIRQLVSTNDTINGVHFHLDNNATYGTLIRVFDICIREKAKNWIPNGNDIWVFYVTLSEPLLFKTINIEVRPKRPKFSEEKFLPPHQLDRKIGGNDNIILISDEYIQQQIKKARMEKINKIIDTAKSFALSEILFIIMIILTIKQIYRRTY